MKYFRSKLTTDSSHLLFKLIPFFLHFTSSKLGSKGKLAFLSSITAVNFRFVRNLKFTISF